MPIQSVDPDARWLYRVGGISALVLGVAYIIIFPLYAHVGAPPTGDRGEVWLSYLAGEDNRLVGDPGLSVLTDFLFVPVALSLYLALKGIHRDAMLVATAFVGLFVVLDLAVTWTHYASLLTLSGHTPQPRATSSGRALRRRRNLCIRCAVIPPDCCLRHHRRSRSRFS